MLDFILLMHNDTTSTVPSEMWEQYLASLRERGVFLGGSAICQGESVRKTGAAASTTDHLSGFIRIRAHNLSEAKLLVTGNPVFECGGTIEIRELPRT
jgi:hypothetical protein